MRKILLSLITALLLMGCEKEQEGISEAEAIPVTARPPEVKDLTLYVESIGVLQPAVSLQIRPQVSGQIAQVFVKEGDWVKQGAPLFQIDPRRYAINVEEREAQLAMDLAANEAAQKKLSRFEQLARKDLVAQTEWDDLSAEARKLQASIQLNEARLNAAHLQLEQCTIVSPLDGRVGKLDLHPGILVSEGQMEPLVIISQLDPLIVEFSVTEKEFPKITDEKGTFNLKSLCGSGICMEGTVSFLDNQFNSETGLLLIRGRIPNPAHTLRAGQSVKVKLPFSISSNAKLIPQKAIRYNQEGPYVYVVQEDKTVALRPLILGSEEGEDQVVMEGVDPGENVVIEGHLRLSPGVKVEMIPENKS